MCWCRERFLSLVLPDELPIHSQNPSVNPLLTPLDFCDGKSSVVSKQGPGNCPGAPGRARKLKGAKDGIPSLLPQWSSLCSGVGFMNALGSSHTLGRGLRLGKEQAKAANGTMLRLGAPRWVFFPRRLKWSWRSSCRRGRCWEVLHCPSGRRGWHPWSGSTAGIHHIHHLCWVLCANTDKEKGDKATGQFPAPVGTPGTARPAAPHSGQAFPALHPTAPRGRQDSPRARPSATVHLQDPRTAP